MNPRPPEPPTDSIPAAPAEEVAAPGAGSPAAVRAEPRPVPRWAIHRRLYDWVVALAETKQATPALAAVSFAESSFFPIPPDVLLIPLCLGERGKAWWFASVCTIASVLGAGLGYAIGWGAWETVDDFMYRYVPGFTPEKFDTVEVWYERWGVWVLFAAAFTPIPFKVFTIAGGVLGQALVPFLLVSTVGRGLRFFLVAGLMWWFGPKAKPFIEKHFNTLTIALLVLALAGVVVLKYLG